MFNLSKVTIEGNVVSVYGFMGSRFKTYFIKMVGNEKRLNALFNSFGNSSFSFNTFFTLEVIRLLEDLLKGNHSFFGLYVGSIKHVIESLREHNKPKEFYLDMSVITSKLNFEPLKHQLPIYDKYIQAKSKLGYRGLLLNASTGSGKTFISISLSEALLSKKMLYIIPLQTLEKVWIKAFEGEIYKKKQHYYIVGSGKKYKDENIIIATYENIEKVSTIVNQIRTDNTTVVIDESHNFADSKSVRTTRLIKLIEDINPANVIPMSGTPVVAYRSELSTVFYLIDSRYSKDVNNRFSILYKTPTKQLEVILRERFGEYSVTVEKKELNLEEPKTHYISIKLKNGDYYTLENIRKRLQEYVKQRLGVLRGNMRKYEDTYNKLYSKAKATLIKTGTNESELNIYEANFKLLIKLYKNGELFNYPGLMAEVNKFEDKVIIPVLTKDDKVAFAEAKTIVKYVELKVQGEALANVVMKSRMDCYKDIAENLNYDNIIQSTEKKTIIFSDNISVCDAAVKRLSKDYKPITVYGDTAKDLSTNVGIFTNKPNINPLVTTYKSLSTGVPLIAANVVLCINVPFRQHTYDQAIARVWRIGQDRQVHIYIPELDTGSEKNINTRNIDIITFFKTEVEKITGTKLSDIITKDVTISNEDYSYIQSRFRSNILSRWASASFD